MCIVVPTLWTAVQNSRFKLPVNAVVSFAAAVVILSAVCTSNRSYQPAVAFRLGAWIVKNSCTYFGFKVEFEDIDAVKKAGPSLFVLEPHGVFPVSIFWGTLGILPTHKILFCASNALFYVPMAKHILTWTGMISADKKTIVKYLNEGYSINICPGGVQEVRYLANKDECVMFLKARTGIIRLALEQGVCLIPSITFGLHRAYDYHVFNSNIINAIARKIGFFPMIFLGLYGIPFGQAKPCPLTVVVGKPLKVPKIVAPTADDVLKYQNIFLSALEAIYESNKEDNDMGHIRLRIV